VEETGRHVRLMESYGECEIRLRDNFGGQNATFGLLGKIEKQFLLGGHLPPKGGRGGWSKGLRRGRSKLMAFLASKPRSD